MNIKWNACQYIDCLEGMKQLKDKTFDLGITDPPYNLEFRGKKNLCKRFGSRKESFVDNPDKIYYDDKNGDFKTFVKNFLDEMIRVCNWVILTPGHPNLYTYIEIKRPSYNIRFWYKPNDQTFVSSDPILIYGKSREIHHIPYVLRHNMTTIRKTFGFEPVHPCPKAYELWLDLIQRARPASVLDPFLGSGTTAQVCEFLGIPWLGFEIVEQYKVDVDKRIEIGQRMRAEAAARKARRTFI